MNAKDYKYYGARGIRVCLRWRSFANFLADMGHRPAGLTLDRSDNDKGYNPDNCQWATNAHQQKNRRHRRSGLTYKLSGLPRAKRRHGLAATTSNATASRVSARLKRGWPLELAIDPRTNLRFNHTYKV